MTIDRLLTRDGLDSGAPRGTGSVQTVTCIAFVEHPDTTSNPVGACGVGEIGITGVAQPSVVARGASPALQALEAEFG